MDGKKQAWNPMAQFRPLPPEEWREKMEKALTVSQGERYGEMLVKHLEALRMREEELLKEGVQVYEKAKAAALRAGQMRQNAEKQADKAAHEYARVADGKLQDFHDKGRVKLDAFLRKAAVERAGAQDKALQKKVDAMWKAEDEREPTRTQVVEPSKEKIETGRRIESFIEGLVARSREQDTGERQQSSAVFKRAREIREAREARQQDRPTGRGRTRQ